jgi:uncharacterized membrane protein (DUF106 family)
MISQVYQGMSVRWFFPFTLLGNTTDWIWFYFVCSLLISLVVSNVLNAYDTRREKKEIEKENQKNISTQPQT